ncbi:XRE family transcriptional regulator [Flectobacillus sp. DC10W]|jgi:Zn-dependent peptidase ImmA (M78 family)/DNA-binding XRE family transcriptional regulator|uniref:XRE family transcriptional regulator n=1 Tax=Flectobacillus longus TaxID=2984207 RepID=A0ABT6YIB9_9BACT|nr:XRE family transcriptional regulator [Flectobacillus longus]MDI9863340.1 XRE family transcriptional regulator [Flectobacillus longus]
MKEIVSSKIKQARILQAMSLQDLADRIGVSKQMISKYEKGDSIPSSKMLIMLAKALEVKMDYFFLPSSVELGEINFRKKNSFSVKKINSLKEKIKIELSNYLEIENILQINNSFENPVKRRKVSATNDIEEIVSDLRIEWEIGFDPIHNIIQLLEDKEIKIIEINEPENNFDGLATIINGKYPVVVLNKSFSVERKRFTLLHELGHLLLELPECDVKFEENICNRFAAEFLFPQNLVIKEFGSKRESISFRELVEVQKKYGISIRAIIYRLKDANIFSENRLTEFYKKLNFNPALKKEIDQERFQSSEVSHRYEQLVYRALSQELISINKAASLLSVSVNEVLKSSIM